MNEVREIKLHASRSSTILIGYGLKEEAGRIIRKNVGGAKAVLVCDETVGGLYGNDMAASLAADGYDVSVFSFPAGEQSKNLQTYSELLGFAAKHELSRSDVLIAFGGGVAGDLGGFAAATYMRGINLVQIPTSLLAMVDSSVGGKTAVDLPQGKNLAGAFYQPDLVICDPSFLKTLPSRIYQDGFAEIIKYGILSGRALFDRIKTPEAVAREDIRDIIADCIELKAKITESDEKDRDTRQMLNLGHTAGHAIEVLSGYEVSHGRSVAAGLLVIAAASHAAGICSGNCMREVREAIEAWKLCDASLPGAGEISHAAFSDKKRRGEKITAVFIKDIGDCFLKSMSFADFSALIEAGMQNPEIKTKSIPGHSCGA